MVLRVEAGREQRAVLRRRALALAQHVGAQAARQLGLMLDGAVLRRTSRVFSGAAAASWLLQALHNALMVLFFARDQFNKNGKQFPMWQVEAA